MTELPAIDNLKSVCPRLLRSDSGSLLDRGQERLFLKVSQVIFSSIVNHIELKAYGHSRE
jgi:hypothetical protein